MSGADWTPNMVRSFLYVPGDRADRVSKALAAGADAVLIDLEDAVAWSAKPVAREVVVRTLRHRSVGPEVWVRVNGGDAGRADLEALAQELVGLDGVVVAKCDSLAWLDDVAEVLGPSVSVAPLIESAVALRLVDKLCAHPAVHQLHIGEIDLAADVAAVGRGAQELLAYARVELVVASMAAGLLPPIGGVYADVRDLVGLEASCAYLHELGFAGRPALHPAQVEPINRHFRPSADEIEKARLLVAYYDEALRNGVGVLTDDEGRMIDEAVIRHARRLCGPSAPRSSHERT